MTVSDFFLILLFIEVSTIGVVYGYLLYKMQTDLAIIALACTTVRMPIEVSEEPVIIPEVMTSPHDEEPKVAYEPDTVGTFRPALWT